MVEEAKTDENLRIELQDEFEQLKKDQQALVVIFAARGPEEGATPLAQVSTATNHEELLALLTTINSAWASRQCHDDPAYFREEYIYICIYLDFIGRASAVFVEY